MGKNFRGITVVALLAVTLLFACNAEVKTDETPLFEQIAPEADVDNSSLKTEAVRDIETGCEYVILTYTYDDEPVITPRYINGEVIKGCKK